MHESDVMAAAVHAARASPSRLHHPSDLAPPSSLAMPHPMHPFSHKSGMDKKHLMYQGFPDPLPHPHQTHPYHPFSMASSSSPFLPPSSTSLLHHHPSPHTFLPHPGLLHSGYDDDDDFVDEDIDEEDMSDLEEFEQEFLALRHRQQQQQQQQQQEPDMTRQLLDFASMVNGDIQKYFGRKKGDDDSCDVYEDKWVATKSGRELYYADLLRMAQGDFGDSRSSRKAKNKDTEPLEDNVRSFSGKANATVGLGGLETLFELGLGKTGKSKAVVVHSSGKRGKADTDSNGGASAAEMLPMNRRKLPPSFWKEPSQEQQEAGASSSSSNVSAVVVGGGGNSVGVIVTNTNSLLSDASSASSSSSSSSTTITLPPTSSVLHSLAKLPDFTDLMENWGGEHHHHQLQQHHQQQQQHYQLHHLQQQHQQHSLHHLQHLQTSGSFSLSGDPSSKKRRM